MSVDTRFKPGRSGNPKGRPKKISPTHQNDPLDIIMGILTQPISIVVNSRRLRGPGIKLAARRIVRKAASGNSRAVKIALQLIDLAYAWENKNIPRGQMQVFHIDKDGIRRPGRPTRPPHPEKPIAST